MKKREKDRKRDILYIDVDSGGGKEDREEGRGRVSAGHTLAHTYVQNICRKLLGCDFTRVTTTQI